MIEENSERLDRYLGLHKEIPASRTLIQALAVDGYIMVAGKTVPPNFKLRGGETIRVVIPVRLTPELVAEDIPLEIVFEDDHLAVVNKPAGLVTHPGVGNRTGTLVNAIMFHFDSLSRAGETERPGIVHRLDKETSGLLIVAKTNLVHEAMQEMIQSRDVKRTYMALICGHMKEETGIIDLPLGRARTDRMRMTVTRRQSREAQTEYLLQERFRSYDLLEVKLHTGRTHQIRVHFSHLGHPVFGDPQYGGREVWHQAQFGPERPLGRKLLGLLSRQALHAKELKFVHPITEELIHLICEPPEDFQQVLDILRSEP